MMILGDIADALRDVKAEMKKSGNKQERQGA